MTHPSQPLHWISPPRQSRTQQSLERLLDAAEELLLDKCFDDVHVAEVARRADTSVAAFYRRFTDKDALLHALHERLCEEVFATANDALRAERWEGAGVEEILASILPFFIEAFRSHASLDRAIHQRALSDELLRERSMRLARHVITGLSALLLERHHEIHHPEPELAVSFALAQMTSLLVQHYTAGFLEIELVPTSDEQVSRELARTCLTYLGIARQSTHPPGTESRFSE